MRSTGGETEKEWCGDGWESREGGETSSRQTANLARTMVCFSTLNTSTRCNFDSPFCNNDCLTLCFRSQFQLNILQINITRLEFFLLLPFRHFYAGGILLKRRCVDDVDGLPWRLLQEIPLQHFYATLPSSLNGNFREPDNYALLNYNSELITLQYLNLKLSSDTPKK